MSGATKAGATGTSCTFENYDEEMGRTLEFAKKAEKCGKTNTAKKSNKKKKTRETSPTTTGKQKQKTNSKKRGKQSSLKGGSKKKKKSSRSKSSSKDAADAKDDDSSRYLSSLGVLTKKFVELLQGSNFTSVDLNTAAERLGVQKRRIYDITNVLEGIKLIEKLPKGHIMWRGCRTLDPESEKVMLELREELTRLTDQEQVLQCDLHQMISVAQKQLADPMYAKHAYITLKDVKSMKCFDKATVMAIKAPMGTTLEVPDPDSFESGNGERRYNAYLKSIYGPIDVFLVSQGKKDSSSRSGSSVAESEEKTLRKEEDDKKKRVQMRNGVDATTTDGGASTEERPSKKKKRKVTQNPEQTRSRRATPSKGGPPEFTIPSPIKLNTNSTPLKIGSLSPFIQTWNPDSPVRSSVPSSMLRNLPSRTTGQSKASSRRRRRASSIDSRAEEPVVMNDASIIQLLPSFDDTSGYMMGIMEETEGISDLFSPRHSFDPSPKR